jgi:RNA polymerase sigma factor (sigma-70 family)
LEQGEQQLVAAARQGSRAAFAELVRRHQQAVRSFLRKMRADVDDADDAAQEAFLAAWSAIARFEGRASFRSWVCGIAWRKLGDSRRSQGRRTAREEAVSLGQDTSGRRTDEERLDALALLGSLPTDQRAVVALCLAGDFSHTEAAEALGLPLGTVKSHATRGRAKLLQIMGEAA